MENGKREDSPKLPDGAPLKGWIMGFVGGRVIIGRPTLDSGAIALAKGFTGPDGLYLKPAFEIDILTETVPQQTARGIVGVRVQQRNLRPIATFNEIVDFTLPPYTAVFDVGRLSGKDRQEFSNIINATIEQAQAEKAGIVLPGR